MYTYLTQPKHCRSRTLRQCSRAFRTSFRFDCIPTLPGRRPRDELRRGGTTACGTASDSDLVDQLELQPIATGNLSY